MKAEYIAGFFDGEGHVTIRRCNRYLIEQGRQKSPSYRLCFGFTNKSKELLLALQQILGGKIYPKSRKSFENHAQAWELFIGKNDEVCNFLNLVGPHIILKANQIALAHEFLNLPKVKLDYIGRGKTWPIVRSRKEDLDARENIKQRMKILNSRGKECQLVA